jgi:hypothetical protein
MQQSQKIYKNGDINKSMQHMQYLPDLGKVDTFYPSLILFKALEMLTSKRLVKFVEI